MSHFLKSPGKTTWPQLAGIVGFGAVAAILASGMGSDAIVDPGELATATVIHGGTIVHCDAEVISQDFGDTFECGDVQFAQQFNAADGVGINVGDGGRFSRVPRADLDAADEWAGHEPARATGPNAAACATCHFQPAEDGAGPAGLNVIRDPQHAGKPGKFIQRNTPALFGLAGLQLLAEEMTQDLHDSVTVAEATACAAAELETTDGDSDDSDASNGRVKITEPLVTKGMECGEVVVRARIKNSGECKTRVNAKPVGVDKDLIVKPFQWKGNEPSLRTFNRGAFYNELGMTPEELVGPGNDADFDGVVEEINIRDVTAQVIYIAGQPRPTTNRELSALRDTLEALGAAGAEEADALGLPALDAGQIMDIEDGEALFFEIGCASCHKHELTVVNPIFSEPSASEFYREDVFPSGQIADMVGAGIGDAVTFDITMDNFVNDIHVGMALIESLGNFKTNDAGEAVIELWGDLKRHDMGPRLAENIDEAGTGNSVWITKELWGVGSTGQYLHDGRATTLTEAILEHGGEALASRDGFDALTDMDKSLVIDFLNDKVIYKVEEED